MSDLREDLRALLNRHCAENGSSTPDYLLAEFLMSCLGAFNRATVRRDDWHGVRVRFHDAKMAIEPE